MNTPTEQRVMASSRRNLPRPTAPQEPVVAAPGSNKNKAKEPSGKGRRILAIALVLGALASGIFGSKFIPALNATEPAEPSPTPVEVVEGGVQEIESLTLNLAGGHYLRLGVALQLAEAVDEVEKSKVYDTIITVYSGRAVAEVTTADGRETLRTKLVKELKATFPDEVLDVYLTDYVTQ